MRKILFVLLLVLFGAEAASARFTVTVPKAWVGRKILFKATEIRSMVEAQSLADLVTRTDTLTIRSETFTLEPMLPNASCYRFLTYETPRGYNEIIFTFYAVPADELTIALSDERCSAAGTPLMEQVSEIQNAVKEAERRYMRAFEAEDTETAKKIAAQLFAYLKEYVAAHPDRPGASYAVMELTGAEDAVAYGANLTGEALASMIYPLAQSKIADAEKRLAKRKKQHELETTAALAPDFTLSDMRGNRVALSDFRGKWVVLDFWGSWCGWCIKGFPELKEAYTTYAGRLEIVGIDCNDTPEAWRKAVERYELPWVQLYNSKSDGVKELYGVQNFPTKVIIDPEGRIRKVCTGHVPEFFRDLDELMQGRSCDDRFCE